MHFSEGAISNWDTDANGLYIYIYIDANVEKKHDETEIALTWGERSKRQTNVTKPGRSLRVRDLKKKKSKNRIEKNIFNGDHLKKRNIF